MKLRERELINDKRLGEIIEWLRTKFGNDDFSIEPASSDASFRRYFRVIREDTSWIVMDAPPKEEDVGPFIRVAKLFAEVGINVPRILMEDRERGFLLLDDLGKVSYLEKLSPDQAGGLYADALDSLLKLQLGVDKVDSNLPAYDELLLRQEMGLFQEWFLEKLLCIELPETDQLILDDARTELVSSALEQPSACVHRDYHSRNLMVTENGNPGIIDFQDAVIGPITYDLVSLLRDCYISWPDERIEGWLQSYHQKLINADVTTVPFNQFLYWFDLMGMQRHMKAIGIFSRLKLRDGKEGYLADIPRTLDYVRAICRRREQFSKLGQIIDEQVIPKLRVAIS
ncbi:MAG: aminoglycoside phosphotransferase [Gammaproteobacteria bacterium]|nr:MAG: aminoglycoside phosphotransferase [Gammaproteobacteria bacterium]RLA24271.1 MAG: aminoglycoside phosphotransferase [Gammaproteobacteria bacterium]